MRAIVLVMITLILLIGGLWISQTGINNVGDSDLGDNTNQDDAEQTYRPISGILRIFSVALPWIVVGMMFVAAISRIG